MTGVLRGGEFLLTTGIALAGMPRSRSRRWWRRWPAPAWPASASSRRHAPASLLTGPCRRHELPLLVFGAPVRFVDITHVVHERLVAGELADAPPRRHATGTAARGGARGARPGRRWWRRWATRWTRRCCSSGSTGRRSPPRPRTGWTSAFMDALDRARASGCRRTLLTRAVWTRPHGLHVLARPRRRAGRAGVDEAAVPALRGDGSPAAGRGGAISRAVATSAAARRGSRRLGMRRRPTRPLRGRRPLAGDAVGGACARFCWRSWTDGGRGRPDRRLTRTGRTSRRRRRLGDRPPSGALAAPGRRGSTAAAASPGRSATRSPVPSGPACGGRGRAVGAARLRSWARSAALAREVLAGVRIESALRRVRPSHRGGAGGDRLVEVGRRPAARICRQRPLRAPGRAVGPARRRPRPAADPHRAVSGGVGGCAWRAGASGSMQLHLCWICDVHLIDSGWAAWLPIELLEAQRRTERRLGRAASAPQAAGVRARCGDDRERWDRFRLVCPSRIDLPPDAEGLTRRARQRAAGRARADRPAPAAEPVELVLTLDHDDLRELERSASARDLGGEADARGMPDPGRSSAAATSAATIPARAARARSSSAATADDTAAVAWLDGAVVRGEDAQRLRQDRQVELDRPAARRTPCRAAPAPRS